MSHLPTHWSAVSEKRRPRVRHTCPQARGPRAGVSPPRSSFFTHALYAWVGVAQIRKCKCSYQKIGPYCPPSRAYIESILEDEIGGLVTSLI